MDRETCLGIKAGWATIPTKIFTLRCGASPGNSSCYIPVQYRSYLYFSSNNYWGVDCNHIGAYYNH
ncbi:hypothetical protein [Cylindrospermopsis curvispora]|uniref:Uncharacterized protein n=1 Tax=Cylindrospermopsis curvispora GIHE-G1 TaxID=2666332 RepID=A0A7H0F0X6_9CYAN|nr:hypothetical protein [Cylindrospermopsis curvispora]QNP29692.1 hypothetical protein IAR63_00670 [Cylindrospermopsis curvispora GIHE-G1]